MIRQWLILSILTVMVGMFSLDLIVTAIDAQITMQLEQVEKILNDR